MYYQQFGEQSQPPLVLLHSGGMAGIEWLPQIKTWSKHFHLLVPDLPGHGQSLLADDEPLSIAMMANAVISMLKKENIAKAHVLGSSMGGAVALWIAINAPEFIDKLIVYRIGYTKNGETFQQTQNMSDPAYWQQYGMHSWLSKLHSPQGDKDSWKTVIANVSKVLDPKTSDHNHHLSDLSTITQPTLLITGDNDPLIPLETVLEMRTAIANCAVWIMPNATHITASNTWRAAAFAEEVNRFLR